MFTPSIFYIPDRADIVVVSDFFKEDLIGGAELTLDAILKKAPNNLNILKLRSREISPQLVESGKNKHWILVNFSQVNKDSLLTLATSNIKYSIIESDYKYCQFRSSHLHKLQTGKDCDCNQQVHGRFISGLFKRAHKVHFMSEGQLNEYRRLFPAMNNFSNLRVQGSTFHDDTLETLDALNRGRKAGIPFSSNWVVLTGGSWIKNQQETEDYCKKNNMDYVLLGGMQPREFIEHLSKHKGLVFHPKGFDTAPRLTMEAKVIGLELDLNKNVQHKDEPWFAGSREVCLKALTGRAEEFWKNF